MITVEPYDVLVIGLGPAGSTAAQALARRGCRVLAVDKSSFPRDKVCGGCLSAHAVSMLSERGISSQDIGGVAIDNFTLWAGGRETRFALEGGIAVSRRRLDALLALRAEQAGANVRFGVLAQDPVRQSGAWHVTLRSGSRNEGATARALVVCEGLGAKFLNGIGGFRTRTAPASHIGVGTTLTGSESVAPGTIGMILGRGGYLGLTVLEDGNTNAAAAVSPRLARAEGSMAKAVERIVATSGYAGPLDVTNTRWRGTPPLTVRTRPVAREGVFVVGDAASYVEPFTGEGMTWAIDAGAQVADHVLAWVSKGDAGACSRWDRAYRRNFSVVQKRCRVVARALRLPTASSLVASMLNGAPTITTPIVRYIHGANW